MRDGGSICKFSPGTSQRPGLNWAKTAKDCKIGGPQKPRTEKDHRKTSPEGLDLVSIIYTCQNVPKILLIR